MTRGICLLTFLLRGGFSRVELGAWPVCGRFGVSAAWRPGWVWVGVSRLEAAAVYICIPDKMPRWGYTPQSPTSGMA